MGWKALRDRPVWRTAIGVPLAAVPFVLLWLQTVSGEDGWLLLGIMPVLAAAAFLGRIAEAFQVALTALVFFYAGLREEEIPARLGVWLQIAVLGLTWGVVWLFRVRQSQGKLAHFGRMSVLEERLIASRERYKTDLMAKISNQKKIHKYFLLNRVSRIFGSQMELSKLAEAVVKEARDIVGPERGRYMLAFVDPGGGQPLVKSLPEGVEAERVLDDQFGIWTSQHRSTLLVSDIHKDFRFRSEASENPISSLMIAPLLSEGHVTGILRAESAYPGVFSTDDLRLFTILADLAGAAQENAVLYQRTQELALTDGLTHLYLRRFFNQRLEEECKRFQEYRAPFSLLLLDLDHFKRINDHLGHLAGDQVLTQLAQVLREEARVTDILCRYGGEEFVLLLPSTPSVSGMIMAERIRSRVAQRAFGVLAETLRFTVSLGVAGCPDHGISAEELIKASDEALYAAKREGRNRVRLAGGGA